MYFIARARATRESRKEVPIISGDTPWFANWLVTIASEAQSATIEFHLLELKLIKELLNDVVAPVITISRPFHSYVPPIFNTRSGDNLKAGPYLIPVFYVTVKAL